MIVRSLKAGDQVEWTTSAPHDRVLMRASPTNSISAPSRSLRLSRRLIRSWTCRRATDGDGDFATASFSIGIDGTGPNDDGLVAGVDVSNEAQSTAAIEEDGGGILLFAAPTDSSERGHLGTRLDGLWVE